MVQKFYGDKEYAVGYLTVADFLFAELSYYIKTIAKEIYEKSPFFEKVKNTVEGLPEVKGYYEREGAIKYPFLPPSANVQPKLE